MIGISSRTASYQGDRRQAQAQWSQVIIHALLFLLSISFLLPFILVVAASFSSEQDIGTYGFAFWPRHFSTLAYQYILQDPTQLFQAYGVSITVTVAGSLLSLLVMSLLAYVLSRKHSRLRGPLSFIVFFTMLFNGGLVPFYILVTQYLHIQDTLFALILPYLVVPWYVLLLRTYFSALPTELLDAARVDGASEWRVFFQIVIPLSTPALATVGLFSMLQYWNDWWLSLLFINNPKLVPIQYLLYKLIYDIDFLAAHPQAQTSTQTLPTQTVRMAMVVLIVVPISVVFIFVQRYFVRGITIGSLKGE